MFASALQDFGNQVAVICDDGTQVSYRKLADQADAIYRTLPSVGRTLVAVECNNSLSSVLAYLGALRNNFPVLLLDARLAVSLREQLYSTFGIPYVWSENAWLHRNTGSLEIHPDLGLLLSTSGSTGARKLVRLTHANLDSNAASIAQYLKLSDRERPITTLPMYYSYGLSVLNSHLAVGATVLLTSQSITAKRFWDFFREYKATSFAGVPATYRMLKQLRFETMQLPTLKTMTQAGGRLAPELVKWFGNLARSRGQEFFVMYGQTEATARISYVPSEQVVDKAGSIGKPIPGGKIDLVEYESGNRRVIDATGTIGEIRYCGPNVMMGYATSAADFALPDLQNGVLMTGDLAWRDEDNYFHIVGRLNRMIKVFGNRIDLDEVEEHLQQLGYDVAVTGQDELLVVAVRTTDGNLDALLAQVSAQYRLHRSAIRIVLVEDFPRSSAGKLQYAELLNLVSAVSA